MELETLIKNLKEIKLPTFSKEYLEVARLCEKEQKPYEQYLAILAKQEVADRKLKKAQKFLKEAKLPVDKDLEEFDFSIRTGITKKQAYRLAEGDFLDKAENVIFYGSFGVGKSHLAMSIVKKLTEKGKRCYFISTQKLISILIEAQQNLKLSSLFKRLDKFDLIVLDELGYTPQNKEGADLFFQFISDRYERKSLMITTNLTFSEWEKVFLDPITTQAAIDRIIHNSQTFNFVGASFRAETAKRRAKEES